MLAAGTFTQVQVNTTHDAATGTFALRVSVDDISGWVTVDDASLSIDGGAELLTNTVFESSAARTVDIPAYATGSTTTRSTTWGPAEGRTGSGLLGSAWAAAPACAGGPILYPCGCR